MERILKVRDYVNHIIDNIPSEEERRIATIHTYGVAQLCTMIAVKRGLNPELAHISGLLHDIYTYFTGSSLCHSISGADMARTAIRAMNIFTQEEKEIILSAIFYHSDKAYVHDEYDEVLKDADVLQHYWNDVCFRVYKPFLPRTNKVLEEFGMVIVLPHIYEEEPVKTKGTFKRSVFVDIAEGIASQNVCGERDNEVFMNIIKYYPEPSAIHELKNYWCAAFVYHCAWEAGLKLPIKQPPYRYRFAGVGTWYEWATDNHFCFHETDGFIPSRGDIVIYNNIIPPENKQKNSPWHDHIGVVLSCEKEYLLVAEGNINNQNVSGVIKRKRDHTIGCFVRIPDGFEYDGCNYKAYLKTL
ncbi:MAG: hypothetical protein K0R92_3674 [Lachnospiraceae bacterium]|nr:hypothetical protein [Lachnospiraceae bacterium]